MSAYATLDEVKLYGLMPAEDVDALEVLYPGITVAYVTKVSGHFDSMLVKRYAAPFQSPYPDAIIVNVCHVVAYWLYRKRGFNPSSEQDALIKDAADLAIAWAKEAADGEKGLVELPIRQTDLGASSVASGAPLAYSEQSPYTWTDRQRERLSQGGG